MSPTEVNDLLKKLNPPKAKPNSHTWQGFYASKGFNAFPVETLLQAFELRADDLSMALAAGDEYDEEYDEEDDLGESLDDLEVLRGDVLHLFRILMALATPEVCQQALSRILSAWDFVIWPQLNDDISAAVLLRPGQLEPILQDELAHVLGEAASAVIKTNAILVSLDAGGLADSTLMDVLRNFHEYHPENVLVALLSLYNKTPNDPGLKEALRDIFELDYVSFLGISEGDFKIPPASKPRTAQEWFSDKTTPMSSLTKSLRWFGIMGRWEFHYYFLLGEILSGQGGMAALLEAELADEDTEPLSGYSRPFVKICEAKAQKVEAEIFENLHAAPGFLLSRDLENSTSQMFMVQIYNEMVLRAFSEAEVQEDIFLRSLDKWNQQIENLRGGADFSYPPSESDLEKARMLTEAGVKIWNEHYGPFVQRRLQTKLSRPEPLDLTKVLNDFGIDVV